MKINNGYNQYVNNNLRYNKETTQAKSTNQTPPTSKEEAVKIELSDAAKQVAEANNNPVFSQKVLAIKEAIQKGTYEVSPEQIAEKMVDEMSQQGKGLNE